jgi:hypothetical protein
VDKELGRATTSQWFSEAPREVVTVHVSEVTLHLNNSSSLRKLAGDLSWLPNRSIPVANGIVDGHNNSTDF